MDPVLLEGNVTETDRGFLLRVLHFSTSGEAFHITVGCGSPRFFNGKSIVLPDAELDKQYAWAREVITETVGTIAPLDDARSFRATRRLPKSFERATAVSQRIDVAAIDTTDLIVVLQDAAVRLRLLYEAQSMVAISARRTRPS